MKREIRITSDGSHTLYAPEIDEHYHSIHGAIQESSHVFINNGIHSLFGSEIRVLEVGFGTGLNALLTSLWSKKHNIFVDYTGVEAFPVELIVNKSLNYPENLKDEYATIFFNEIISADWHKSIKIHSDFRVSKIESRLEDFDTNQKFDIVYFDAFGPTFQKELWDIAILEKMFNVLNDNGVFVTYCAMGQLKRDLKKIGFKVESLPGPPGKREMTRGIKF